MILVDFSDEELKMVISALGYVRHPEFTRLADRMSETLWGSIPADNPS